MVRQGLADPETNHEQPYLEVIIELWDDMEIVKHTVIDPKCFTFFSPHLDKIWSCSWSPDGGARSSSKLRCEPNMQNDAVRCQNLELPESFTLADHTDPMRTAAYDNVEMAGPANLHGNSLLWTYDWHENASPQSREISSGRRLQPIEEPVATPNKVFQSLETCHLDCAESVRTQSMEGSTDRLAIKVTEPSTQIM